MNKVRDIHRSDRSGRRLGDLRVPRGRRLGDLRVPRLARGARDAQRAFLAQGARVARHVVPALISAAILLPCIVTQAEAQERSRRSPGLAFLLSAAVPGAGQAYLGERRGFVYAGAEAGLWFTRLSYIDAGNRKRDEYEAFARRHWSFDRYNGAAGSDGCLWSREDSLLLVQFWESDRQQYYEEIGKYDRFRCGWDDFASTYDPGDQRALSPNRRTYRSLRETSNNQLNNARKAVAFMVVNRVVSSVDAYRSARSRAESGGPPRVRLESTIEGTWNEPRAVIRLTGILP